MVSMFLSSYEERGEDPPTGQRTRDFESEHNREIDQNYRSPNRKPPKKPLYKRGLVIVPIILLILASILGYILYTEYVAAESLEYEMENPERPDPGLESIDIPIEMEFYNPSRYDTPYTTAVYDIYVEDEYVGEGDLDLGVVPAGETIYDEQVITVDYDDISEATAEALKAGDFKMILDGEVTAEVLFETIPVTREFEAKFTF
ncbi:MAG: hypothetical protein ACOCTN_08160 [Candidatus Natronoplasma sp.]